MGELSGSPFLFVRPCPKVFLHERNRGPKLANSANPLLIKRYASRRLYNTETSDYVTLDDVATFIRAGRDVQIIDLKSGDDLTRQYLLQIIAEHEASGENVLPINLLTDLVRGYASETNSMVPQFLSMSFDMLRESQSKMMGQMPNPLANVPGFEAMQAQQKAFLKAMSGNVTGAWNGDEPQATSSDGPSSDVSGDDLDDIKKQLAELQEKLANIG